MCSPFCTGRSTTGAPLKNYGSKSSPGWLRLDIETLSTFGTPSFSAPAVQDRPVFFAPIRADITRPVCAGEGIAPARATSNGVGAHGRETFDPNVLRSAIHRTDLECAIACFACEETAALLVTPHRRVFCAPGH
jgi:hypothetical protein